MIKMSDETKSAIMEKLKVLTSFVPKEQEIKELLVKSIDGTIPFYLYKEKGTNEFIILSEKKQSPEEMEKIVKKYPQNKNVKELPKKEIRVTIDDFMETYGSEAIDSLDVKIDTLIEKYEPIPK